MMAQMTMMYRTEKSTALGRKGAIRCTSLVMKSDMKKRKRKDIAKTSR